jgi:hypothetical protein
MNRLFLSSFMCPHCNTRCSFYGGGKRDKVVLWCNGCHGGVYFHLQNYDIPEEDSDELLRIDPKFIIDYYPHSVMTVDPSIPKEIADDYNEANRCIEVKASKATVTQCRRALQNTCVLKGANPKADLIDQVDELESKRLITPGLKDIAHTIRIIANWGAHPQKDPLKEVTFDDALEILKFTSEFLEDIFVRPARLQTLKVKKG